MRSTSILAWGLVPALALACGCSLLRRKPPEPPPDAVTEEGFPVRPGLLPTGRTDGVKVATLIRGKVVAVDKMLGLVVVNIGEKHGVPAGAGLTVYRGEAFIGRIVVDEVFPDMSSAHYGKTMKGNVEVGDEVTTKLATEL